MERHEEMLSPEEQYAQLAPTLDTDGFSLYAAAEEVTGLKVYEEFPYEDNRGMFELADGHTLLRYLEAAYFGTVTWEIVPAHPMSGRFSVKWIRPHRSIARFIRRSVRVQQRTSKNVLGRRHRM